VKDLFARVAPRYDLINEPPELRLHRAWKRRVVRMANVKSGERALESVAAPATRVRAGEAGAVVVASISSEACSPSRAVVREHAPLRTPHSAHSDGATRSDWNFATTLSTW